MRKYFCFFALLLVVLAVPVTAYADKKENYVRKVEMITTGGNVVSVGSATLLVPENGIYVTARHTVANHPDAALHLDKEKVSLLAEYVNEDVLFFKARPVSLPAPSLRGSSRDERVVALGFRKASLFSDLVALASRKGAYKGPAVFKTQPHRGRVDMFDAQVESGMSGGAFFAEGDGLALVGIITDTLNDRSFGCSGAKIANMMAILKVSGILNRPALEGPLPEISKIKI